MKINKTENEGKTVFALEGRLDTTTSPGLQEELIPEFDTAKEVELDFADLVYISSAGLRVLLLAQKTAAAKNRSLAIKNASADIKEIFEMTGFSGLLTIL